MIAVAVHLSLTLAGEDFCFGHQQIEAVHTESQGILMCCRFPCLILVQNFQVITSHFFVLPLLTILEACFKVVDFLPLSSEGY